MHRHAKSSALLARVLVLGFPLAVLFTLPACFTPTRQTVYGYMATWKDGSKPHNVYREYKGQDGAIFVFDRVDDLGYLRGTCTLADKEISGACAAAKKRDALLVVYPTHPGASPVNPEEKSSSGESEAGWEVATFNIQGDNLVCRAAAGYFDWGPSLNDMAWGECIGEKRPARLTATSEERLMKPPEPPPKKDPAEDHADASDDGEADADKSAKDAAPPTVEERLEELKRLHDKGLITDEEYEEKRKEILDDL